MNNQFDELTKSMAQSVTRRAALKKFGVGLAGMALACLGLSNRARAATYQGFCQIIASPFPYYTGLCMDINGCVIGHSTDCPGGTSAGDLHKNGGGGYKSACGSLYKSPRCSFTV
jgi:hypothetical protein